MPGHLFTRPTSQPKHLLRKRGGEDLEKILELENKHLEQIGVHTRHKLKLINNIKEITASESLHVSPCRQFQRQLRRGRHREPIEDAALLRSGRWQFKHPT
jgi:hypothetical protein